MADYKWLDLNRTVRRNADGAFIPNDAGNRDWKAFQDWLGQGNTPDPADPPPTANDILVGDRTAAINDLLTDPSPLSKLDRAILLVVLDEVNVIRTQLALASRTVAQFKTAVQTKLNSGAAD